MRFPVAPSSTVLIDAKHSDTTLDFGKDRLSWVSMVSTSTTRSNLVTSFKPRSSRFALRTAMRSWISFLLIAAVCVEWPPACWMFEPVTLPLMVLFDDVHDRLGLALGVG